ncbi:hypothetical protein HanIR_Chr16g0790071 [Helianthus annuus]|nr:hypothetical protein HanIR_Chr16g0790071 [Helianthus annuus]
MRADGTDESIRNRLRTLPASGEALLSYVSPEPVVIIKKTIAETATTSPSSPNHGRASPCLFAAKSCSYRTYLIAVKANERPWESWTPRTTGNGMNL